MQRTLVFDTETTGLIDNNVVDVKRQPLIIEFYGCHVDFNGKIIDELEFRCNPGIPLEPIITKITGLRDEDLKAEKSFKYHAQAVCDFIGQSDSVVAHNFSYDWAMINFEMQRAGLIAPWPLIRICTVEETEWFKGHRLNLSALHEHLFGETFQDAHRAKNDVMALVRCFNELRERGDV